MAETNQTSYKNTTSDKIEWDVSSTAGPVDPYRKLRSFYGALKDEIIPGKPLHQTPIPGSINAIGFRESGGYQNTSQYGWELHRTGSSLLIVEYALDNFMPPYHVARDIKDSNINGLWLTASVPVGDLEKRIDELIKKHVLAE